MTRRESIALFAAAPMVRAAESIDAFFESFLKSWMKHEPEMSTSMRFFPAAEQDEMDAKLSDVTDEAAHARIGRAHAGLAALRRFDRAALTPEQRLSADMLEWQLDDIVREEPFLTFRLPLNQFIYGTQVRLPTLLTDIHPLRNKRDAENYLARLEAFGSKIDQAAVAMRARAAQGIRPPAFIAAETIAQMRRFTAPEPEANILVTTFSTKLAKIGNPDGMAVKAAKIVRDSVYPSYRRAMDGLATAQAKSSNDAGLWRLPKGAEAYEFYLRRYTTTSMTAEQIPRKGLEEVARIESEMNAILKTLGRTAGPVAGRFAKLSAENVYPDSANAREQVLADYAKIIGDADERSRVAFDQVPKARCIVQRIPEFQEANAAANYQAPPRDGSRPGIFRVPLRGPQFPKIGMRTLAYHEAIPGHHFQLALQVEMESLPGFRRSNPFGGMSAFTEGWGLYAERLASELGWYKGDPMGDLGRLNGELFRARRLVVDTGLHAKKWTREQAVAYGIQQSEVDRYVVVPGQACSYKIGQLRILELREQARKALGAEFSLKQFHNVVLSNGAIPLTLLERVIGEWTKSKLA
jgi:uncharacterized protein (DUF885 family)